MSYRSEIEVKPRIAAKMKPVLEYVQLLDRRAQELAEPLHIMGFDLVMTLKITERK